jgi:hypothetical protein
MTNTPDLWFWMFRRELWLYGCVLNLKPPERRTKQKTGLFFLRSETTDATGSLSGSLVCTEPQVTLDRRSLLAAERVFAASG